MAIKKNKGAAIGAGEGLEDRFRREKEEAEQRQQQQSVVNQSTLGPNGQPVTSDVQSGTAPLPPPPRMTPEEARQQPGFVSGDSNRPVGVLMRGGQQFVVPKGELRNLGRQGDLRPGESFEEQQNAQGNQGLAGQVGQFNPNRIPGQEGANAFQAGLGAVGTNAQIVGGGIGAGIGAVIGGPAGALAGSFIGGAIGTFIQNAARKVKQEEEDKIAIEYDKTSKSTSDMKAMIRLAKDPRFQAIAVERFNKAIQAVDDAEGNIKLQTQKPSDKFLAVDGGLELGKIRNWDTQVRPRLETLMQQVLDDPSSVDDAQLDAALIEFTEGIEE